MEPDLARRVVEEFASARRPPGTDPDLEAVRTAVFVEDAFGIRLADDEIDPQLLADPEALLSLVRRHRGLA